MPHLKLNDIPLGLKKDYEEFLRPEILQVVRQNNIVAILIFIGTFFLDYIAIPSSLNEVALARGVIIAALVIAYFISYTTLFFKYYTAIVAIAFVIPASGINYAIYLSQPSELAYYTYFSGLAIMLLVAFSEAYLDLKVLFFITACIVLEYALAMFSHTDVPFKDSLEHTVVSLFLLSGAIVTGLSGKISRTKIIHKNFFLQHSLNESIIKKNEEAKQLQYHLEHDFLTGIKNRRFGEDYISRTIETTKESDAVLAILFLDLNNFKTINDVYGHDAGDIILQVIAKRLRNAIRKEEDGAIRLGGDEFLVYLNVDKKEKLDLVLKATLKKIEESITSPIKHKGHTFIISASIGTAVFPDDADNYDDLLKFADKKMYSIKQKRKTLSKNQNIHCKTA